MRRLLFAFAAILGLALTGPAPAYADDAADIRAVIADQIAAFRADQAPRAYDHAAPSIQAMFPNPDIFMRMVRDGYAPVYRPSSVAFGALGQDPSGQPLQEVDLIGPDGLAYRARYRMERQADGTWKISGVWLERIGATS